MRIHVFAWESVTDGSDGFVWSESPAELLTELATKVNAPDDDMYREPIVKIVWVGTIEIDLKNSIDEQVDSYLQNSVW